MEAITDLQRKQLRDEGYLLLKQVLTNGEVDELVNRLEELWTEEGDLAGVELVMEPGARRLANLLNKGDVFKRICSNRQILDLAKFVLGTNVRLSSFNARSVPPRTNPKLPLHADGIAYAGYSGKPAKIGFNAFTAIWMLNDFTCDNGATRIVPKTHLGGEDPYEVLDDICAIHPDEIVIEGRAGDVLVFNGHCWHSGGENRTNEQRRALLGLYTRVFDPIQTDQRVYVSPANQARMSKKERELLGLDDGIVVQIFRKSLVLRRIKWEIQKRILKIRN